MYDAFQSPFEKADEEPSIGRADILFAFLKATGSDKPTSIRQLITDHNLTTDNAPIAEQIIDLILEKNPLYYKVYEDIRCEMINKNPYKSTSEEFQSTMDLFMSKWVELKSTMRNLVKRRGDLNQQRAFTSSRVLTKLNIIDNKMITDFESIRRQRNQAIHGIEMPTKDQLLFSIDKIDNLLAHLNSITENEPLVELR